MQSELFTQPTAKTMSAQDRRAFEREVLPLQENLYGAAMRLTRDPAEAEDRSAPRRLTRAQGMPTRPSGYTGPFDAAPFPWYR